MESLIDAAEILGIITKIGKTKLNGTAIANSLIYKETSFFDVCAGQFRNDYPPFKNNPEEIINAIHNKKNRYFFLKVIAYKYGLFANELLKIFLTLFNFKKVAHEQKNNENKENILFVTHTNALFKKNEKLEVDRIQPLIDTVSASPDFFPSLSVISPFSHSVSFSLLKHSNLLYKQVSWRDIPAAAKNAWKLSSQWRTVEKQVRFNSALEQTIFQHLKPTFSFLFSFPTLFIFILYYEAYERLFMKNKTKAIVIYAASNILDKIVIAAAKSARIPIFWVFHGISMKGVIWDHPENLLVCSTGQLQRNIHIHIGANPDNLYITGPLFLERSRYFRSEQRQRVSTILFCTAPIVEEGLMSFEEYAKVVDQCVLELKRLPPNFTVIIKPHPLEREIKQKMDFYAEVSNKLPNATLAFSAETKDDFYGLIRSSDLVISFFSNSLFDALLANRPALMINLYDMEKLDRSGNFLRHTLAIPKISPSQLYLSILNFTDSQYREQYNQKAKKMLTEWFGMDDSSDLPSTKIFKLIKDTIRKKSKN